MARITPEIHNITRIGANGTYVTGGMDIGPHRDGGGGGGGCDCSWNDITGKPNFARVATTGSYTDLGNKPTIPEPYDDSALDARVTALERGGGGSVAWNNITGKPNFATVATSGSYNDLTNKPNLATVATTGSYNDLSNKPTIPPAYDDTALKNRVTALENTTSDLGKLAAALTVSNAVGQATAGKNYAVGTPLETVLRDILTSAAPVTYTITFNPNGGTVSPTSATTGTDGKLASLPTPTHATDTFINWYTAATGGTLVTTNTVFTSNDTIYAHWQGQVPPPVDDLPIFGTFTDIDTLDEVTVDNTLGEYEFYLARQYELKPAYFDVPASWTTTVYVYNAITSQWQVSRDHDASNVTHTINGNVVAYTRYTDNREADAGQRRMRITWTV